MGVERRLVEAMNRGVTALLARLAADDGPLASDRAALDALRQQTTELERRLGDAIAALSEKIAVARASVTPIVAGKGFESAAVDDLAAVTAVFGDHVEQTGDKLGSARTKAGDVVLHLAESIDGLRVAVECRTGTSSRLTLQAARDAMINRGAAAALLLADRPELLPRDAEQTGFRIYFGESVVALHHDRDDLGSQRMLAVAVQVARLLARLNSAQSGAEADLATIGDSLARMGLLPFSWVARRA